jgi:hypothetical protein
MRYFGSAKEEINLYHTDQLQKAHEWMIDGGC